MIQLPIDLTDTIRHICPGKTPLISTLWPISRYPTRCEVFCGGGRSSSVQTFRNLFYIPKNTTEERTKNLIKRKTIQSLIETEKAFYFQRADFEKQKRTETHPPWCAGLGVGHNEGGLIKNQIILKNITDDFYEQIFEYGSTTKLGFCSKRWLGTFEREHGDWRAPIVSSWGELRLTHAPLLDQVLDQDYSKYMFILDLGRGERATYWDGKEKYEFTKHNVCIRYLWGRHPQIAKGISIAPAIYIGGVPPVPPADLMFEAVWGLEMGDSGGQFIVKMETT